MDCKSLSCTQVTKQCRCYAKPGKENEQFCAYKKNSIVIPCDAGCCDKGCPGQCAGVPPSPPYGIDTNLINIEKIPEYLKALFLLVIILIIASTLTA